MDEQIVINPDTLLMLQGFAAKPSQAVILSGQKWILKKEIADYLAYTILGIGRSGLDSYPYRTVIKPDPASISIEEIRKLNHVLSMKVPGKRVFDRIIEIYDADKMTAEAQNALLKNLEEPPTGTVFILTASKADNLLPTVISRCHLLPINPPNIDQSKRYLSGQGYPETEIKKALSMAGGLVGLAKLILEDPAHPLKRAAEQAKEFAAGDTYIRLKVISQIKDRPEALEFLFMLKTVVGFGMGSAKTSAISAKMLRLMKNSIEAEEQLTHNGITKLVLLNLAVQS